MKLRRTCGNTRDSWRLLAWVEDKAYRISRWPQASHCERTGNRILKVFGTREGLEDRGRSRLDAKVQSVLLHLAHVSRPSMDCQPAPH